MMAKKSLLDRILSWPEDEDEQTQENVWGFISIAFGITFLFFVLWSMLILPSQKIAAAGIGPYTGSGVVVDVAFPGDSHFAEVTIEAGNGEVSVYKMDKIRYFENGAPVVGVACNLEFRPWWTFENGFYYVPHLVTCGQDA